MENMDTGRTNEAIFFDRNVNSLRLLFCRLQRVVTLHPIRWNTTTAEADVPVLFADLLSSRSHTLFLLSVARDILDRMLALKKRAQRRECESCGHKHVRTGVGRDLFLRGEVVLRVPVNRLFRAFFELEIVDSLTTIFVVKHLNPNVPCNLTLKKKSSGLCFLFWCDLNYGASLLPCFVLSCACNVFSLRVFEMRTRTFPTTHEPHQSACSNRMSSVFENLFVIF